MLAYIILGMLAAAEIGSFVTLYRVEKARQKYIEYKMKR